MQWMLASRGVAEFAPRWQAYFSAISSTSWATLGVGATALAIIVGLRKLAPKLPGFLIAVVVSSVAVIVLKLPVDTIGSRFPDMPSGLPMPSFPEISLAKVTAVLPSAFTIAFLAGIEALLSAVVADGMTGTRHRSNQELVGQGIANLGSALFGGLPATGAIARTATNIRAGAKTPIAGILHAVFLLLFILFGTDLMAFVPMAALAAILFVVAWGMSEYVRVLVLLRMPGSDRVVLLLTFGLTVLVDLTVAIGVGVTLASLLFMTRMAEQFEVDTSGRQDVDLDDEDADQRDSLPAGVEVFRINGPFFFGVAGELLSTLRNLGANPRVIIVRLKLVPLLDASGLRALEEFVEQAHIVGAKVVLSGLRSQPRSMLEQSDLKMGAGVVFHAADFAAAQSLAVGLLGNSR